MRTTMDKAGRVVIPKELRERLGLVPGEVDLQLDGAGLHLEPVASDQLAERAGRPVVPATGSPLTDDEVRALRDADRR
jgi:AbrB family looped-hinge helix DNA binding protein